MSTRSSAAKRPLGIRLLPYLQVAPLALVMFLFLILPLIVILVVSFYDYDSFRIIPDFVLTNYAEMLTSTTIWRTLWQTVVYTLIVLAITSVLGFLVAYYIAFYIKSPTVKTAIFLACTVPFLTSNVIRMISWVPYLGRNGILNSSLMDMGLIAQPLDFLLYSKFAIILVYVYLFTLFMVTPLFNVMMRIDKSVIEAAVDAGAKPWQIMCLVVLPMTRTGFAIGAVFIITLVMGDFITVRLMGGGQSASTGLVIMNQVSLLQYPAACANAVLLLVAVMGAIGMILRGVNIRSAL
ncbi:MAG: ABC transporter permease [Fulvimarina manganoxydans]|uniref:ABC transporter permease n=1 Tax=Fulvimarina manganoxydans TaxID=937218 RepID=UPI00235519D7|nr:ABC transporter permease [Fulvimarina manganoxydans]MCK5932968.1 ABC transporter permease [Fulvimarina manganoxydans]